MNRILLLCSHLESGVDILSENLNSGSKLQKLNGNYNTIDCLFLKKENFQYNKRPKFYFDNILFNHEFSCKELFKYLSFVYLIGDPRKTITNIVYSKIYDEKTACNYYCFRVRRIYEMIKKSKNYIVFFDEDLLNKNIYKDIHDMLGVKDRLKIKNIQRNDKEIRLNKNNIDEVENFYEKYRYKIKQL